MSKVTMKRQAFVVLGIAAAIGVPEALANHVPGGLYKGTHSFTLKLPAGTPFTVADGAPCTKFSVVWKLAPKFFGGGLLVITLKLVDAGGRASGTPGFLVRSPKR